MMTSIVIFPGFIRYIVIYKALDLPECFHSSARLLHLCSFLAFLEYVLKLRLAVLQP